MLEATTLEDIWLHDVIKLCSRTHNHPEKANKEKKKSKMLFCKALITMFKGTTFLPALLSTQLQVKQDLGIC